MAQQPLPLVPWSKTQLSTARHSSYAAHDVQNSALDLYTLGYQDHAKHLLDTLYEVYRGFEFVDTNNRDKSAFTLCHVWDAGRSWEPWAFENESSPFLRYGRNGSRAEMKEAERMQWTDALPENLQEKAEKGTLGAEDAQWAYENMKAGVDPALTIGLAVQIAMIAGETAIAEDIIAENVWKVYAHVQEQLEDPKVDITSLRKHVQQRLDLGNAPLFWKAMPDHPVTGPLQINEAELQSFVDAGCALIQTRFTQGPTRPYSDHSTADLVKILDESYVAARKARPDSGTDMSILHLDLLPSTFLAPGATDAQIAAREKHLHETSATSRKDGEQVLLPYEKFPADYVEFLKITNGFEVLPAEPTGLFSSLDHVGYEDAQAFEELEFTLFPYEYTSVGGIDNIALGDFRCFIIGAGGDEGSVWLIPPSSVRPVIEEFERVYEAASEEQKLMYRRAAVDLYGGLERVRELQWLCIVWYHWDPEQKTWGSFREYLEECARYAVHRREEDEAEARQDAEAKQKEEQGTEAGGSTD